MVDSLSVLVLWFHEFHAPGVVYMQRCRVGCAGRQGREEGNLPWTDGITFHHNILARAHGEGFPYWNAYQSTCWERERDAAGRKRLSRPSYLLIPAVPAVDTHQLFERGNSEENRESCGLDWTMSSSIHIQQKTGDLLLLRTTYLSTSRSNAITTKVAALLGGHTYVFNEKPTKVLAYRGDATLKLLFMSVINFCSSSQP
jgi:hypothetical protein